jgi:hypothetical protein
VPLRIAQGLFGGGAVVVVVHGRVGLRPAAG